MSKPQINYGDLVCHHIRVKVCCNRENIRDAWICLNQYIPSTGFENRLDVGCPEMTLLDVMALQCGETMPLQSMFMAHFHKGCRRIFSASALHSSNWETIFHVMRRVALN